MKPRAVLLPWQVSLLLRAIKLRRQLSNKALAARFGLKKHQLEGRITNIRRYGPEYYEHGR